MSVNKETLLVAAKEGTIRPDITFTELEKGIYQLGFAEGAYWALNKLYQAKEVSDLLTKFKIDVLRNHHAQITNMDVKEWFNNNKKK